MISKTKENFSTTAKSNIHVKFSSNGLYIGPDRPFYTHSLPVRVFATFLYGATTAFNSSILLIALSALRTAQCLLWLPLSLFSLGPSLYDNLVDETDYCCTLLHNLTALCCTIMHHPFFPMSYPVGFERPSASEMRPVIHPMASSTDKKEIDNLHSKLIDCDHFVYNRVRRVFSKPAKFIAGRLFYMSNHLSNVDGIALRATTFPSAGKCMYKKTLQMVPILGQNFLLSNDICVPFVKGVKGGWATEPGFKEALKGQVVSAMRRDMPVIVFPEGTRSQFGRMVPFRRGMFELAVELKVPIWPSALFGSQFIIQTGEFFLNPSEMSCMYSKNIIYPHGHSVDSLIEAVREEMLSILQQNIDGFDPLFLDKPIESISEFKQILDEADVKKKTK